MHFIVYIEDFFFTADATSIQVITGKGNHSADGRPKIKPAVVTFLKRKKYG